MSKVRTTPFWRALTSVGIPTIVRVMPTATSERAKTGGKVSVVQQYETTADAKGRISLRKTRTRHFHVKALSNGGYLLEPRVLVPLESVSPNTLKMIESSAQALKHRLASEPVDLTPFLESQIR